MFKSVCFLASNTVIMFLFYLSVSFKIVSFSIRALFSSLILSKKKEKKIKTFSLFQN